MNSVEADGEPVPSRSMAQRILAVLEACSASPRPLTLTDLRRSTGLPKPTLHRLCRQLVELNALQRGPDGFHIGERLFAIGAMSPAIRRLRMEGAPFMRELVAMTGAFAYLAVMSDEKAMLVEETYGPGTAGWPGGTGRTLPLHATAVGKALIMHGREDVVDSLMESAYLQPYTSRTIVRPRILREHLLAAEATGFTVACEEYEMGVSGIGAPIVVDGQTVAAIALRGPFRDAELATLSTLTCDVAHRFSASLAADVRSN